MAGSRIAAHRRGPCGVRGPLPTIGAGFKVTRAAVMDMEPRRSVLRWASEYVVTAERAGNALLVTATIALIVGFCLPWWSVRAWVTPRAPRTYLTVSTGFSGWGWLSFVAALVALALTTRLMVARGTRLDKRMLGWATVAAGVAELLGSALFIITAPKTEILLDAGRVASRGVGLTIAIVAGVVLVASGLLMLVSRKRQTSAPVEQDADPMMAG